MWHSSNDFMQPKLPTLKPIFHTHNNQNLQVGWVIKNYTGSFLLTGKNIYIWLSINLESILYLSSIKFFKYWINKQGKDSNHNLQSREKQHIFSMYQLTKTLQTGCFATFGFSACQGNLSWNVQFLPHKFLRN